MITNPNYRPLYLQENELERKVAEEQFRQARNRKWASMKRPHEHKTESKEEAK